MKTVPKNIHPEFARHLGRAQKEALLKQCGKVVWLYGLSGSGKSTLANALEKRLHSEGLHTVVLDADNVRTGLNRDLGFSDEERRENIRRAAETARLFLDAGVIVLTAFITPKRELRELARGIIGAKDFFEIFVKCSYETCARRDVKGLYAKARAGEVEAFTGRDSIFEEPENPNLLLDTEDQSLAECLEALYALVMPALLSN